MDVPLEPQEAEAPRIFHSLGYIKMTRLSALDTCRINIQEISLTLISVRD